MTAPVAAILIQVDRLEFNEEARPEYDAITSHLAASTPVTRSYFALILALLLLIKSKKLTDIQHKTLSIYTLNITQLNKPSE